LDLYRRSELAGVARNDDKIATLYLGLALHDLAERPDGVDDRGSGGIRGERRKRLKIAVTVLA
jgi:hypothetical protein